MGFACPSCGGSVIYDIVHGNLKCEHCGSEFDVMDFRIRNTKEKSEGPGESMSGNAGEENHAGGGSQDISGFRRYVCTNCGAEIDSLDTDLTAYCQYCGGQVVLEEGVSGSRQIPDRIIPFSLSRRKCINRYRKFTASCHFLPKEYKDADFLKKFTGIYIPEWTYQTKYNGDLPFTFSGNREISYDTGESFQGHGSVTLSGYVEESKDASSRLDDAIADSILPKQMEGMKPFYPGYMAGFYADAPDVSADTYSDLVLAHAENLVVDKTEDAVRKRCGGSASVRIDRSQLPEPDVSLESTLVPVWFLTWKKKDRVAYSVMNGQTGECCADMPVSLSSFAEWSLITAACIAAVLLVVTHFILLTPDVLLFLALFLSLPGADLFRSQLRDIALRENHVYDRGYMGNVRMRPGKIERLRGRPSSGGIAYRAMHIVWLMMIFLIAIFNVFAAVSMHGASRSVLWLGEIVFFLAMIRKAVQIFLWAKDTSRRAFALAGVLLVAFHAAGLVLLGGDLQNDLVFYGASAAALVLQILEVVLLTKYYNLLATRPVPGFHTGRKGGSDENART